MVDWFTGYRVFDISAYIKCLKNTENGDVNAADFSANVRKRNADGTETSVHVIGITLVDICKATVECKNAALLIKFPRKLKITVDPYTTEGAVDFDEPLLVDPKTWHDLINAYGVSRITGRIDRFIVDRLIDMVKFDSFDRGLVELYGLSYDELEYLIYTYAYEEPTRNSIMDNLDRVSAARHIYNPPAFNPFDYSEQRCLTDNWDRFIFLNSQGDVGLINSRLGHKKEISADMFKSVFIPSVFRLTRTV